jgi:hypothetical protein
MKTAHANLLENRRCHGFKPSLFYVPGRLPLKDQRHRPEKVLTNLSQSRRA